MTMFLFLKNVALTISLSLSKKNLIKKKHACNFRSKRKQKNKIPTIRVLVKNAVYK